MTEVFLPIKLSPIQQEIVATHDANRFTLVVGGRQFGKTTTACAIAVRDAARGQRIWWVVPTYSPYGTAALSKLREWLFPLMKHIPGLEYNKGEQLFTFPGGGYVQLQTAYDPSKLRSATLDKVIFDEAAYAPEVAWYDGLVATLMVRQGNALLITTPNGRNWIYKLWMSIRAKMMPGWAALHYTSALGGFIPPEELERQRISLPERSFRQEFLGEFIDDASSVFRGVYQVATASYQSAPVPGHIYVGGLDWGRVEDFTTFALIDATTREMVYLDRFNQVGWDVQSSRIRSICERWRPAVVWAESNAVGQSTTDALIASGLPVRPFHMNPSSKPPLIQALALAIEQGQITLLNDDILTSELLSYEETPMPSGGYRYGAPKGMHDDTVIATALAWYGIMGSLNPAPTVTFLNGNGLYGTTQRRLYPQWTDSGIPAARASRRADARGRDPFAYRRRPRT